MVNVGLDLQALQAKNASGYGYYLQGLQQALEALRHPDVTVTPVTSKWKRDLSTVERLYHDRIELPRLAEAAKVDVVHQPCFSCPKSRLPVIWTLHDLRSLVLKEQMSPTANFYWRKWLPYSARYATKIVCISENTRHDAIHYLKLDPERISVIPVGVPQQLLDWRYDPKSAEKTRKKFNVTGPFFTSVGTLQPIKNFPFLIDVFAALRNEFNLNHQLVLIGKKAWDYPAVSARLVQHGFTEGNEVVITDYVTDDEKWSLMHDSEAFLFPSLYEGFGIPPIEAQAIGVPILSSDASSLPDVIGAAGILCSPHDVQTWIKGYAELKQTKADLITAGKANLKKFQWETIAAQWLDVYRSFEL